MVSTEGTDGCFIRGLQWLTVKLRLLEDGATPPRWKYMMLVFACFFSNTFCSMVASPFLPAMVLHLGKSENEKGTFVGLMTSCVFAGVFLGSMFWGWLADKKGRKVVLLLSIVFTSLGTTAFSMSWNIPMAMVMRFFSGLLNGIATTCRAVLYDTSDNTNQSIGMAILAFSWGAGMLTGSFVGGFLAQPCSRWPEFCDEDSLFGQFPFLLPAIIPALASLIVAIVVFFQFDETLVKAIPPGQEDIVSENGNDRCHAKTNNTYSPTAPPTFNQPFSQDNDRASKLPVPSVLQSRSVTSLHPAADVSMWLGKDVLQRRSSFGRYDSIQHRFEQGRIMAASHSDIGLECKNGKDRFHLYDLESIKVVELSSIHNRSALSSSYRARRAYSYGGPLSEYKLSGSTGKLQDITIYAQCHQICPSQEENNSIVEQNALPLLNNTVKVKHEEEDDNKCTCCDTCFNICCPTACVNTSIHKLLRLSDVWSTVCLYFVLCFATIGTEDIFPVFASTSSDIGGLGFSTSELGTALGLISVPLLVLQIKIYPFLVARLHIRKTYILMALVCLIDSQALPMLKILNNSPTWLWSILMVIQTTFRIATNCCFASASLLVNNSVPQFLAGQVNGVSMTASAIGRFIAPVAAGSLYSWSITHGQFIGAPFDAGFPFFLFGMFYGVSLLQCLVINAKLERQKK